MSKRPSRTGGYTEQAEVKQRVELRDDGEQQESDVEMVAPSVQGPQGSDVQLGPPPSSSQVASDDDLAVPGQPRSKMKDNRTLEDHASLNAIIFNEFPSTNPATLCIRLEGGLRYIASQNGYDIIAMHMFEECDWLRDLLIDQWNNKSFMKVRRLGECPLYTFSADSVA